MYFAVAFPYLMVSSIMSGRLDFSQERNSMSIPMEIPMAQTHKVLAPRSTYLRSHFILHTP
jgi:hypothetical protein